MNDSHNGWKIDDFTSLFKHFSIFPLKCIWGIVSNHEFIAMEYTNDISITPFYSSVRSTLFIVNLLYLFVSFMFKNHSFPLFLSVNHPFFTIFDGEITNFSLFFSVNHPFFTIFDGEITIFPRLFPPVKTTSSGRACLKAMAWSLSLAERRRLRGVPGRNVG